MNAWEAWSEVFPDCPPMGELLRGAASRRWVRIHSLPGGVRTPRDGDDDEVLFRNNVAASAVLGVGSDCVALLAEWEPSPRFASWSVIGAAPPWQLDDDARELALSATFRARTLRWQPGQFDGAILDAARGEAGCLAVVSLATQGVYCPYEGGADLFVRDDADRASLRQLLARWLSDLPSGL